MTNRSKNAVLILGGQENTLCLSRSFGRRKIPVYISAAQNCFAFRSRYCLKKFPIPNGLEPAKYWFDLLLSTQHPELKNSVIMVGSDEAVEFVAQHKKQLEQHYLLDDHIPELALAMLDKEKTLLLGQQAGCNTPSFHSINSIEDINKIKDQLIFPIMLKPKHSHLFFHFFKQKKYLLANNINQLLENAQSLLDKNLQFIVTEIIPGPDNLQSSYHTYINKNGKALFHYTHQIIRRYPKNEGSGCLHITEWLPETAEKGKLFFNGIGYQGMGHIEFKYDTRDQKLKIIECNPRFSAAQSLTYKSGLDMAYIIYCDITGIDKPAEVTYKKGVRRWNAGKDLFAFFELYRLGEITFWQWTNSIRGSALTFAYFSLSDPWPFFTRLCCDLYDIFIKRVELPAPHQPSSNNDSTA